MLFKDALKCHTHGEFKQHKNDFLEWTQGWVQMKNLWAQNTKDNEEKEKLKQIRC